MERFPSLCYITDAAFFQSFADFSSFLAQAVLAGVPLIQIREKNLNARILTRLVSTTLEAAAECSSRIVINDRLDVALVTGAAGVHLGSRSLPAGAVHRIVAPGFLVGVSCHSCKEAESAAGAGADYILLGPIFETPSKSAYGPPIGLGTLEAVTRSVKVPVLALGGINLRRIRSCREAGAWGIAGIRIFQECDSIEKRLAELRFEWQA